MLYIAPPVMPGLKIRLFVMHLMVNHLTDEIYGTADELLPFARSSETVKGLTGILISLVSDKC